MLVLRSLIAWLVILVLAIANGAVRESVLIPVLGQRSGLTLSGLMLSFFVVIVAYVVVRFKKNLTVSQGFIVGILWLCLTLVFEFTFGFFVQHKAWAALLEAYTFKNGNIWSAVLVVTLLAPWAACWFINRSRR